MSKYLVVGSATQNDINDSAEGILVYSVDHKQGEIKLIHSIKSGPNPSFFAILPERKLLYCVNETADGSLSSFRIDPQNGKLMFINRVRVRGDYPCYVSVDSQCQFLLIANYGSGSLSVMSILPDGRLGYVQQTIHHVGSAGDRSGKLSCYDDSIGLMGTVQIEGYQDKYDSLDVNQERQESPHAHSLLMDPDGKFALAADLGMDRVWIYHVENGRLSVNYPGKQITPAMRFSSPETRVWTEEGWVFNKHMEKNTMPDPVNHCEVPMAGHNLKPGAGPRHIVFHPEKHSVYVSNELNSTVTAFYWNGKLGCLTPFQVISSLPEGYSGKNYPAHIALTLNGKYLYVSNRGHDSLAAYSIEEQTGLLHPIGYYSTLGNWPRHFSIDSSGQYVYVANQESNSIQVLLIEPDGALSPTGISIYAPRPYFVGVLNYDV